ncbi:MAG: hypothetical protein BZ137_05460 [Methanosphaera sp. rholeuAM130]|nr:MAG: hypothetical protein BZ137_05460 [Methanosphaera sp. rholeuAM130]
MNKKILLFTLVLFISVGAICATEVSDNSDVITESQTTPTVEPTVNMIQNNDEIDENIKDGVQETQNTITYDSIITQDTTLDTSYNGKNIHIYGTDITVDASANLTNIALYVEATDSFITELNITNDNTKPIAITVMDQCSGIYIGDSNIEITSTTSGETKGIVVESADEIVISNNNITVNALPQSMGWSYDETTGEWISNLMVSGIIVDNSNTIEISDNNITVVNSTEYDSSTYDEYSTLEAVTVRNGSYNVDVTDNIINASGSNYIYAISLSKGVEDVDIMNNDINLIGMNYICGIQLDATNLSVVYNNTIKGYCNNSGEDIPSNESFAYGIVLTTTDYVDDILTNTNEVSNNNIYLNSTIAYGIELYKSDDTEIKNNNITLQGNAVLGIGLYNSSDNIINNNTVNRTNEVITVDWDELTEVLHADNSAIKISLGENNSLGTNYEYIITPANQNNNNQNFS